MLRIALESVRDDGRGVVHRGVHPVHRSHCASPPPIPLAVVRARCFVVFSCRTHVLLVSFVRAPAVGDCKVEQENGTDSGGETREDRVDASINVYATCRSIMFVIGSLWVPRFAQFAEFRCVLTCTTGMRMSFIAIAAATRDMNLEIALK